MDTGLATLLARHNVSTVTVESANMRRDRDEAVRGVGTDDSRKSSAADTAVSVYCADVFSHALHLLCVTSSLLSLSLPRRRHDESHLRTAAARRPRRVFGRDKQVRPCGG